MSQPVVSEPTFEEIVDAASVVTAGLRIAGVRPGPATTTALRILARVSEVGGTPGVEVEDVVRKYLNTGGVEVK